jgi:DNA polymerase-3 subunit gamma/tau
VPLLAVAAAVPAAPRVDDDPPPWAQDHAPVIDPPAVPPVAVRHEAQPSQEPPRAQSTPVPSAPVQVDDAEHWLELVAACGLNGPSRQLAANAAFIGHQHGVLKLALASGFEYLGSERSVAELAQALALPLGALPKIVIEIRAADVETLHERANRQQGERQDAARQTFMNDPTVQQLIQQYDARVVTDSIRPYDE